jgi:hypothetical protein
MTTPYEPGEELLAYQTEQADPPEPAQPIEPVPVHVSEPVVTVATVPQHVTCRTITLTSSQPYAQLLPQDPLRTRASILRGDNHFVICHSAIQAQDPVNTTPASTSTNGAYVTATASAPVVVTGTQALWVATNVFPTTVGLIVERRGA